MQTWFLNCKCPYLKTFLTLGSVKSRQGRDDTDGKLRIPLRITLYVCFMAISFLYRWVRWSQTFLKLGLMLRLSIKWWRAWWVIDFIFFICFLILSLFFMSFWWTNLNTIVLFNWTTTGRKNWASWEQTGYSSTLFMQSNLVSPKVFIYIWSASIDLFRSQIRFSTQYRIWLTQVFGIYAKWLKVLKTVWILNPFRWVVLNSPKIEPYNISLCMQF